jgi:hypothetical protein
MRKVINAKKDAQVTKMAERAANLQEQVAAIWAEKDFEKKKLLAIALADSFELGGKDKFIEAVNTIPNAVKLDQLATNAMLKGEGMSTKRF